MIFPADLACLLFSTQAVAQKLTLFGAKHNPRSGQVIRRQLNRYLVSWKDADVMHPHLSRDVSEDLVPVFQLHFEHGIGQGLDNRSILLDQRLFRHTILRGAKIGRYQ